MFVYMYVIYITLHTYIQVHMYIRSRQRRYCTESYPFRNASFLAENKSQRYLFLGKKQISTENFSCQKGVLRHKLLHGISQKQISTEYFSKESILAEKVLYKRSSLPRYSLLKLLKQKKFHNFVFVEKTFQQSKREFSLFKLLL